MSLKKRCTPLFEFPSSKKSKPPPPPSSPSPQPSTPPSTLPSTSPPTSTTTQTYPTHPLLQSSQPLDNQLIKWKFKPYDDRYLHFWYSRLSRSNPKYIPPPTKDFELLISQNIQMHRYAFLFFNPNPPNSFICQKSKLICTLLHKDPNVWVIKGVLTSDEYAAMAAELEDAIVKRKFATSQIGELSTEDTKQRSSSTRRFYGWMSKESASYLRNLCGRISLLTGIPLSHVEEPQQIRYTSSEFFAVHHDAADEWFAGVSGRPHERWSNATFDVDGMHTPPPSSLGVHTPKRLMTALLYLNSLDVVDTSTSHTNGCTYFPWGVNGYENANGTSVIPTSNTAILWSNFNINYNGALTLDPRVLHAGNPVPKGCWKYAINLWFLNKSTSPTKCASTFEKQTNKLYVHPIQTSRVLSLSLSNESRDAEYRDCMCQICGGGNTMMNHNNPHCVNTHELPVLYSGGVTGEGCGVSVCLVGAHQRRRRVSLMYKNAMKNAEWEFDEDVERDEEGDMLLLCSGVTTEGNECRRGICVNCYNTTNNKTFNNVESIDEEWSCLLHQKIK